MDAQFEDNFRRSYTEEEDAIIRKIVKESDDTEAAFIVAAEKLGRGAAGVRSRYYKVLNFNPELEDTRSILSGVRAVVKERDKLREEIIQLKADIEALKPMQREYDKLLNELKDIIGEEEVEASRSRSRKASEGNLEWWTDEEKKQLADIMVETVSRGGTRTLAFEVASQRMPNRTSHACGYMWNATVSKWPDVMRRMAEADRQKYIRRFNEYENIPGKELPNSGRSIEVDQEDTADDKELV